MTLVIRKTIILHCIGQSQFVLDIKVKLFKIIHSTYFVCLTVLVWIVLLFCIQRELNTRCICGCVLFEITSLERRRTEQNWHFKETWPLLKSTWISDQNEPTSTHKTYLVKHSLLLNKTDILSPFSYMVQNQTLNGCFWKPPVEKENTCTMALPGGSQLYPLYYIWN